MDGVWGRNRSSTVFRSKPREVCVGGVDRCVLPGQPSAYFFTIQDSAFIDGDLTQGIFRPVEPQSVSVFVVCSALRWEHVGSLPTGSFSAVGSASR